MPLKPVLTVDGERLQSLSADLWDRVRSDGFEPQMVVGIATGGVRVVDVLDLPDDVVVLECHLRRASTAAKHGSPWTGLLARFPTGVTNWLRRFEDWRDERRGPTPAEPTRTLLGEVALVAATVEQAGMNRVLVVDDAVDSGATLACVVDALRDLLPSSTDLRTASLTVTRSPVHTLVRPDYAVYELTLLRFPWSFDFKDKS